MAKYPISREGIRQFLQLKKTFVAVAQEIKTRGELLEQVVRSNEEACGYLYQPMMEYISGIKTMEGRYELALAAVNGRIDRIIAKIEELLGAEAEGASGASSVSPISTGNVSKHGALVSGHAEAVHDRPRRGPSRPVPSSGNSPEEIIRRMRSIDEKRKAMKDAESGQPPEMSIMGKIMGLSGDTMNLMYSATGAGKDSVRDAQYKNMLEYGYYVEEKLLGGGKKVSESREFLEALSSDISRCAEEGNAGYLTELQNEIAKENPAAGALWQGHTLYENLVSIMFASMIGGDRREDLERYLPEVSAWFEKNLLGDRRELEEGKKLVHGRTNNGR
jgi:hypothetical protein